MIRSTDMWQRVHLSLHGKAQASMAEVCRSLQNRLGDYRRLSSTPLSVDC